VAEANDKQLLVEQQTSVVDEYAPQLVCPILRSDGRANLDISGETALFDQLPIYAWIGRPQAMFV
jgi:NADPH-dependent 7-cyano-7-deazaguanine reductase QueF-like protein